MMLIDSHCHLDDYDDLPAVLANARAADVGSLLAIGIGDGPATMHRALDLARAQAAANTDPKIFATAGIHPQEAHQATAAHLDALARLISHPLCVAIGEIGLDYYHFSNPDIATQQAALVAQIKIAAAAGKPIIIHCRTSELATPEAKQKYELHGGSQAAWDDLLRLLAVHWAPASLPGVMHCFSGNQQQAARALEAGFYLSFAGNLTYPKSVALQAIAVSAPADRILIETDSPFLTPAPLRGQPNQPANVALTAKFLADLRGVKLEALAAQTTANFHMLFPRTIPGAASSLAQ